MLYSVLFYVDYFKDMTLSSSQIQALAQNFFWTLLISTIIAFVIKAIALYFMAVKKQIDKPFLAFIPYANFILIGKLVGRVRLFNKNVKNLGWLVLAFTLASDILNLVLDFTVYYAPFTELIYDGILTDIYTMPTSIFETLLNLVSYGVDLCHIVTFIFLLLAFFRKYENRHPVLYSIVSILFEPLFGLFIIPLINKNPIDKTAEYRRNYEAVYGRVPEEFRQHKPTDNPFSEYSEQSSDNDVFSEFSNKSTENKDTSNSNNTSAKSDDEERRFGFDNGGDDKTTSDEDNDDLF